MHINCYSKIYTLKIFTKNYLNYILFNTLLDDINRTGGNCLDYAR